MATPSYKLIYFPNTGRGEVLRLVFAAAGRQFEDFRLPREKWPQYKKEFAPFEKVPYMEIDGKKYAQTVALATYLAREFGLYGQTNLQCLAIDQILGLIQDLQGLGILIYRENDPDKKAEAMKNFQAVQQPQFLGYFEKMLKENGSGYLVGSGLTLADIAVYDVITGWIGTYMGPLSDDLPLVKALVTKVEQNEGVKAYVATRPKN